MHVLSLPLPRSLHRCHALKGLMGSQTELIKSFKVREVGQLLSEHLSGHTHTPPTQCNARRDLHHSTIRDSNKAALPPPNTAHALMGECPTCLGQNIMTKCQTKPYFKGAGNDLLTLILSPKPMSANPKAQNVSQTQ